MRGAQGKEPDQQGVMEGSPEKGAPELRVEMRLSCLRGERERGEVRPWAFLGKEFLFDAPRCVISPRRGLPFDEDDEHADNHHDDKTMNSVSLQSA